MTRLVVCVLLCLASVAFGSHEQYEGTQLFRISNLNDYIGFLNTRLDLLSVIPATRSDSGTVEAVVRLAPEVRVQWLEYFDLQSISYTLISSNLAEILREEEALINQTKSARTECEPLTWDTYYTHDEVNRYLDEVALSYPDRASVVNAGFSSENRTIKYLKISTTNFEDTTKPVFVIDALIHAREWVSTSFAMYIINQLVEEVADEGLLENVDWIIIPVVNPDGYAYSISEDRLWRKTRSTNHTDGDSCPGVNINRNFDFEWGTNINYQDPCSDSYEGPTVNSEPEAAVIQTVLSDNLDRTAVYISLQHAGSNVLYPWGNNGSLPSNALTLHVAGVTMADAIANSATSNAVRYLVGNAANILQYYTTGTSRDWAKALGVRYTYSLELNGYDYGILVPPTYLTQILTESWAGIAAGANYILNVIS